ncbi:MAG TPA: Gfo/Idh/MocA family oxidoreductase [Clostridia bacterium]|nr:MAG: Glycosyl hydrolase family 109 protein 1 precursor [Firmicutes bacterium ADurb.Bin146]HOD93549.1 Gfo/Idh/MocA family oxidoreductase [Clostridia bacterium]HQM39854.1 Gfo/Idh/MocA family oxidoreductase [Clostridia bacterium]
MRKVRIGVFGVNRGSTMMNYCQTQNDAQLVAICDKWEEGLNKKKQELGDAIKYYTSFDEFIKHDMDAVVLANYANEHAPFAVRALEQGLHVISEVLPCQTMAEAVKLIETIEKSGKIYAYAENYCFMAAPREMRKLYRAGKLGKFEYGEGEYMHNCETIWPQITHGDKSHWRNNMHANFYCTHSIGPLIHITGLKPVSVTGFELPFNARMERIGAKAGHAALELITLENGAVIKSLHGTGCSKNSVWYSIYGSLGRIESSREDAKFDAYNRVFANLDEFEGANGNSPVTYLPDEDLAGNKFGHGGSDYYTMHHFLDRINGNEEAEVIDIYEALDMFLPGMFAYRSVLSGGMPMRIPDLRNFEQRDIWRHDTLCTDPLVAGDQLVPSYSKGVPEIPDETYISAYRKWAGK